MGGRSSSSSSTLTSTTNLSSVKDQRAVADNGAVILQEGASGNTFNSTDFGAILASFGITSRGLDTVDRSLATSAWTSARGMDTVDRSLAASAWTSARGMDTVDRSLAASAYSVDRALDLVTARGELDKAVVLGATSLATKANEQAAKTSTAALSSVADSSRAALASVGRAYEDAQSQAQGNRTLAYVGLTVAGVLALGLLQNRRKA
jgi:hypothetical protein